MPQNPRFDTDPMPLWRVILRYLLPVTPGGPVRFDPYTLIYGYKRYLLRCGTVALALHGLAALFQARGHDLLYGLALAAIFPFGTVAVVSALVWWDVRGRDIEP